MRTELEAAPKLSRSEMTRRKLMIAAAELIQDSGFGGLKVADICKRADFALWRIARPADLAYALGLNPCAGVVHGGVWRAPVVSLPD